MMNKLENREIRRKLKRAESEYDKLRDEYFKLYTAYTELRTTTTKESK